MENENLLRQSVSSGTRANESADISNSNMKKEKDSLVQLRNEFKTAIKDLRNDVRIDFSLIQNLNSFINNFLLF